MSIKKSQNLIIFDSKSLNMLRLEVAGSATFDFFKLLE